MVYKKITDLSQLRDGEGIIFADVRDISLVYGENGVDYYFVKHDKHYGYKFEYNIKGTKGIFYYPNMKDIAYMWVIGDIVDSRSEEEIAICSMIL